ncbi:MAG: hypothetical protein WBL62_02565 [Gallionella sp.]
MKNCLLLLAIALPLSTIACTQNNAHQETKMIAENSNSGMFTANQNKGYIVTAPDAASVQRVYGALGVKVLRALGNRQFEMHLQQDAGIEAVSNLAQHSNGAITAVQPNYSYQAN